MKNIYNVLVNAESKQFSMFLHFSSCSWLIFSFKVKLSQSNIPVSKLDYVTQCNCFSKFSKCSMQKQMKSPIDCELGSRFQIVFEGSWVGSLGSLRVDEGRSILNDSQSCRIEMKKKRKGLIIIKMRLQRELFFDLVRRVEQSGKFGQILAKQQMKYQLQPFKLQGIDCRAIKRIYQSLQKKYFQTRELQQDPHNWNQNQRRVFIWYIIFYTYFLAENNQELNQQHWPILSSIFFNKRKEFLQFQYLTMIKPAKITWTQEEDNLLAQAVEHEGAGRWNEVAKYYFFTSNFNIFKSPKHCRQRWLNHLDNKKKHGHWTPEEDLIILNYVVQHGKRWCKLVPILQESRTEHMIKNRYNSLIKRQKAQNDESEDICVEKLRKQLRKQVQINERKKLRKEGLQMKLQSEQVNGDEGKQVNQKEENEKEKMEEQKKEDENQCDKALVKTEEPLDASFEIKLVPSEKTSSSENGKECPLKEESEVGYILHEKKSQNVKSEEAQQNGSIVKSEQCEPQINNHFEPHPEYCLNNGYAFFSHYNGLGYLPAYPYCWP